MKKIITMILIISTLILFSGCQGNTLLGEIDIQKYNIFNRKKVLDDMPDIVFLYSSEYSHEDFKKYVFDKNGNIYYSAEEEVFYLGYKELLELYSAEELEDKMTLIGTIESSELEENFQAFLEIMRDGGVKLTSEEYIVEMITTQENWSGLYYDGEGNVNRMLLYKRDEGFHYTNDPRVDEIVYWINRTIKAKTPSES